MTKEFITSIYKLDNKYFLMKDGSHEKEALERFNLDAEFNRLCCEIYCLAKIT